MRTIVYVDGFNLYYGSLKGTNYKWLDLPRLFRLILPDFHDITKIKYFTAPLSQRISIGDAAKQKIYLTALRSYCPDLEIILGYFSTREKCVQLSKPIGDIKKTWIINTEEKETDVNIAVHVLNDGWRDEFDCAVIVSNDSDLTESIRLTKLISRKMVGVIFPYRKGKSVRLSRLADFQLEIRNKALARSQLPSPIPNTSIYKPKTW